MKKIAKAVFVTILFVLEGLMALVMTYIAIEDHSGGALASGLAAIVFFYGFALISLAELIRMMLGSENIILPMFGMKVIVVSIAISVGMFADYSVSKDRNAMGAGFTFVILTIALILVGLGIKSAADQKKLAREFAAANELEKIHFTGFNAEWYYDDVAAEYLRQHAPYDEVSDTERLNDEDNDKIYVYACNRIAYLFEWLLKRNGLSDTFLTEMDQESDLLNELISEQGNPSEYIYNYMDGKLCKDDVELSHLLFLHNYYERIGYGDRVREASYAGDYDEIVLDSHTDEHDILYCFDFSWEKYRLFEKRLDKRYEAFLRENAGESMKKLERTIYSETFRQDLEIYIEEPIFSEPFADVKMQAYSSYIEACLKHVNGFPLVLVDAVCEKLKAEWGTPWVGEISRDEFLLQIGAMSISIYKPYGDEIAYVLGFEADFEVEHGVSVTIRDDKILSINYRMDACSPWDAEM